MEILVPWHLSTCADATACCSMEEKTMLNEKFQKKEFIVAIEKGKLLIGPMNLILKWTSVPGVPSIHWVSQGH
jgi:hypothetical protein